MKITNVSTPRRHGWLDHLAIGMAAVCAIHCLLTPILIIALPIIATSFFVHQDFHLWMIFLVLPTTIFAVFMGCRNHKDRAVLALAKSDKLLALANFVPMLFVMVVWKEASSLMAAANSFSVSRAPGALSIRLAISLST